MITVIFASRNGARVLPQMLSALARVRAPAGGWRLIAVDSASTDGTYQLLRSYGDRLPLLVLREERPGKSRAVNRALPHARGELLVFCDDDIVVGEDWLEAWAALSEAHPDYSLFGGLTVPLWQTPPPEWIAREVDIPVVFAVHGEVREGPCEANLMHGNNMAIRASAMAGGVRFNAAIGPDGTSTYPMGNETELAVRLEASGHKCWFSLKPAVKHIIRTHQIAPEWILQRGYRFGRGAGRLNRPHPLGQWALATKNAVKRVVYPAFLSASASEARWRRQWQWALDMGYEDGERERAGRAPIWRDRIGAMVRPPVASGPALSQTRLGELR